MVTVLEKWLEYKIIQVKEYGCGGSYDKGQLEAYESMLKQIKLEEEARSETIGI